MAAARPQHTPNFLVAPGGELMPNRRLSRRSPLAPILLSSIILEEGRARAFPTTEDELVAKAVDRLMDKQGGLCSRDRLATFDDGGGESEEMERRSSSLYYRLPRARRPHRRGIAHGNAAQIDGRPVIFLPNEIVVVPFRRLLMSAPSVLSICVEH